MCRYVSQATQKAWHRGVFGKLISAYLKFSVRSSWESDIDRFIWSLYVTRNDISVIHVTVHRCVGGLKKKLDLRSGSQRHRHFEGFFNVPVQAPTGGTLFFTDYFRESALFSSRLLHAGDTEDLFSSEIPGVPVGINLESGHHPGSTFRWMASMVEVPLESWLSCNQWPADLANCNWGGNGWKYQQQAWPY